MTLSWYSWRGGRSSPQSKNGLMTTECIVWRTLSSVLIFVVVAALASPKVYE